VIGVPSSSFAAHPSRVATRILAVAYLLGFGLSTLASVAALAGGHGGSSTSTSTNALGGYVVAVLLALAGAACGIRAARRRLGVDDFALGLRAGSQRITARAPVAAVVYVAILGCSAWVTVHVLSLLGVALQRASDVRGRPTG